MSSTQIVIYKCSSPNLFILIFMLTFHLKKNNYYYHPFTKKLQKTAPFPGVFDVNAAF